MEKIKLLLYCTKQPLYLFESISEKGKYMLENNKWFKELNGKIVAECDYEVEEIKHYIHEEPEVDVGVAILPGFECDAYCTKTLGHFQLLEKACMETYSLPNITVNDELNDYLQGKNGYAIHIKNLNIFDKPKGLWNYAGLTNKDITTGFLGKAPQNMMKVIDEYGNKYILISIRPEWLCKILNGEKTIEVRKRVLKGMLSNEQKQKL